MEVFCTEQGALTKVQGQETKEKWLESEEGKEGQAGEPEAGTRQLAKSQQGG